VERPVQVERTILSYTDKNLTFDFTALDFSNPHANRFQFYLKGFEPGWLPITSEHRAIYTNLAPGDYTFWVKGTNNDGVWSAQPLRFDFTILPPWWATWWCRAAVLLLVLMSVAAFLRYRKERSRLQQARTENLIRYHQVQTLQAQMAPHSISNILGAVKHEVLIKPPHEAVKQLGELSHLIRLFLNATVNTGLPSKGMSHNDIPLTDEVETLTLYLKFEVLQRHEKFRDQGFAIEIAPSVIIENLRVPPMLIQPFVENAVRHGIRYLDTGYRGFIWVRFSRENGVLTCLVEDDGVGRETAARIQEKSQNIYVSHGTRLVRERIAILNKMDYDIQFNTQDRPGGGTIVTITFRD
jgi:LytS/YehU family sensor histidine kinase